jgi:hydrogenase nickel incorporation protein HypA/HybF
MHELSIMQRIIEIADEEVRKHHASAVEVIELQIGKLAGIETEAFDFAWEVSIKGTVLEKAERKIDYIQGLAKCQDCGLEFIINEPFDECPGCHGYMKDLRYGRELRVKSITILKL